MVLYYHLDSLLSLKKKNICLALIIIPHFHSVKSLVKVVPLMLDIEALFNHLQKLINWREKEIEAFSHFSVFFGEFQSRVVFLKMGAQIFNLYSLIVVSSRFILKGSCCFPLSEI